MYWEVKARTQFSYGVCSKTTQTWGGWRILLIWREVLFKKIGQNYSFFSWKKTLFRTNFTLYNTHRWNLEPQEPTLDPQVQWVTKCGLTIHLVYLYIGQNIHYLICIMSFNDFLVIWSRCLLCCLKDKDKYQSNDCGLLIIGGNIFLHGWGFCPLVMNAMLQ